MKTRCWQRVKVVSEVLMRSPAVHSLGVGSYQWPEPEVGIWVNDADSKDGDGVVESGEVLEQREVGGMKSPSCSNPLLVGVGRGDDLGGDGESAMLEMREFRPRLMEVVERSLRWVCGSCVVGEVILTVEEV